MNGRFTGAGILHHSDNTRKHGFFAHFFGFDFQIAALHNTGADCAASGSEFDRQTFARDRGLVYKRVSLDNFAVYRDCFPLTDYDDVALPYFRKRNANRPSAALDRNRIGREGKQFFHFLSRAFFTAFFEPFPKTHKRHDHCRGLKKQTVRSRVERYVDQTVNERNARAQHDERIHIGNEFQSRPHAADKKRIVDGKDCKRKRDLKSVVPPTVRYDAFGDHVPHGKIHFWQQKCG